MGHGPQIATVTTIPEQKLVENRDVQYGSTMLGRE
jgi:hypothetical protein